jgi:hypothetical protein
MGDRTVAMVVYRTGDGSGSMSSMLVSEEKVVVGSK